MNRSSRGEIRRLQKVVTSAAGTVLGLVATGSTDGGGYGAYYPYEDGARPGRLGRLHLRRRSSAGASSNGGVSLSDPTDHSGAEASADQTSGRLGD